MLWAYYLNSYGTEFKEEFVCEMEEEKNTKRKKKSGSCYEMLSMLTAHVLRTHTHRKERELG
jgi:hypothetical protein